jgi:hypothetical protein
MEKEEKQHLLKVPLIWGNIAGLATGASLKKETPKSI